MDAAAGDRKEKPKFSVKRFLPRTLFGRSLLILITPLLIVQIVTTYMFFDRHWSKMTMRLAYAVAGEITVIAGIFEEEERPEKLTALTEYTAQNLSLLVSFKPGAVLKEEEKGAAGYVWESMVATTLHKQLKASLRRPFDLNIDLEEKWVQASIQLKNGVLDVTLPGRRLFSSSGYIVLLWMMGTSLVLLLVAIIFMRNQIRPIRKLAIAAERFGKGRELASFKPSGAWEVRQAAQAFIDMHKRIRRQVDQRTTMLAGVSHDLRTPLTRLKLQLEMLGDSPDIDAMKSDIQHMERMIGGYLEFVRGEGG